jgi:signal transduction histidine kinase
MRAMFAVAPMPIWLRDETGRLVWLNAAYAAAVEAADEADAAERELELLDSGGRQSIAADHRDGPVIGKRLPVVVAGSRHVFDVTDVATPNGSGGIAIDVTAAQAAEAALRREIDFNARTLDQLTTAVAIFGPDKRLKSFNAAYRSLFDFDADFLESRPDETTILDRLRAARRLPEQADFKSWRNDFLSAYQSVETREQIWHLPDGQTLRVIANPNPQGGMTWVYENVTERLDLESRYNALIHVQGETIDHLAEGVAVFGSDGRLRLHNPSFAAILDLDPAALDGGPHVSDIVAACRLPGDSEADWNSFTTCVAGVDETRSDFSRRMERANARVIDYAAVPLPDGQTMVTFVDVTDSVQVERALVDRNEALKAADALKNAFIQHVSYELRSPLTNIIGFTQLLADSRIGPLNQRQREYLGYVMSSSGALLAIVNDILDLSTIDAGIMELDLGKVDVAEAVAATIEGVQDRTAESRIDIATDVQDGIGSIVADEKRLRQILFNLLANAIAFSPEGGHVAIGARRAGETIEFTVTDEGSGMPADFLKTAFDRFASQPRGEARGGVGLGLAIVRSFAELHGGTVEIESQEGKGSRVVCRLPLRPGIAAAAE